MALQHVPLDLPDEQFKELMANTCDLIYGVHQTLDERKAFHGKPAQSIEALFDEDLPQLPESIENIMRKVEEDVIPNATFNLGPYFSAYVLNGGNQVGMIGDFLSSFLNQNTGKWHLAASGVEMERTVIKWIKEFLHLPVNDAGILVSGGSMANLTCLTVARQAMLPTAQAEGLFQQKPMTIYVTNQVHYCVYKAVEMLGIGHNQIRKIDTNAAFEMDLVDLEATIQEDITAGYQPFCVVASAGTVNTGAVDPLKEISLLCKRHQLWFHIDGAYGGPAAAVPQTKDLFLGMEAADSIAIDPHKWLYVPIEAGCALFKDLKYSKAAFSHIPDYLAADRSIDTRLDYNEHGVQLSRSFKALKIWMTFKAYGAEKLSNAIAQDILKAQYLKNLLVGSDYFDIAAEGPLSIICYHFNPKKLNLNDAVSEEAQVLEELNLKLISDIERDGRVFITGTKINGKTVLRSCFVNHRIQQHHLDKIFSVLEELAEAITHKVSLDSF